MAAWIGVAVLAFNLAAGIALPGRGGDAAAASYLAAQTGGAVVVCTAAGLKIIDPSGTTVPEQPSPHPGLCTFCLPLMHGGVTVPVALAAAAPRSPPVRATSRRPAAQDRPHRTIATAATPRAPPSGPITIV